MSEQRSKVQGRKSKRKAASSPYREPATETDATDATDDAEARVGSVLAWGIPLVSVAGAIAVGLLASMGPALLVLLGGAILGAVMLLWGSVRTLTGDAPLSPDLASASIGARVTGAQERKTRVLRALKDIEHERDVGKMDADDYEKLSEQYRDEAKAVLREIDGEIEPRREKAEALVMAHLEQKGRRDRGTEAHACPSCGVANDDDAAFCKKCGATLETGDAD